LRKYLVASLAAATAIACAGVAIAQSTPASMTVTVSPKKAGTKPKPKSTQLSLAIVNNDTKRTMSALDITMPKTLALSTKGFPACTVDTLDNKTKSACPRGSKVGSGVAKAILGVNNPDPSKQSNLTFIVTAFTGGKDKVNFYLEGIVKVTAPGTLSKKGGKQVLHIQVPDAAQQPAPGVYAGLVSLETTLKGIAKKNKLIATTGCKAKAHPFSTVMTFIDNGVSPAGTVKVDDGAPCS
jgi:hypothetical protein